MGRMGQLRRWIATGLTAAGLSALVVPLVLMLGAGTAFACSCAPMSEQEYYDHADVVFAGRLVDRQEPPQRPVMSSMDPATLTFEVSTVHKGDAGPVQKLTTAQSGASCGLEIAGEGPFLVFADTGGPEGLQAHLCGGTRPLADGPLAVEPGDDPTPAPQAVDEPAAGDAPSPAYGRPQENNAAPAAKDSAPIAGALAATAGAALAAIAIVPWVRLLRRPRS